MKAFALGLRFFLEAGLLAAMGVYGWQTFDETVRWIAAIGLPLVMVTIWGTFNVPGDPSRSGRAPVAVPGRVRLGVEISFFTVGLFALANITSIFTVIAVGLTIVVQYLLLGDRMRWLLDQPRPARR